MISQPDVLVYHKVQHSIRSRIIPHFKVERNIKNAKDKIECHQLKRPVFDYRGVSQLELIFTLCDFNLNHHKILKKKIERQSE